MRDCFSEHSVRISSSPNCLRPKTSCTSPSHPDKNTISSRNVVVCLYRALLPNQKEVLVKVTWTAGDNSSLHSLAVAFDEDRDLPPPIAFDLKLSRKPKGAKPLELPEFSSKVEVFWDFSSARFKPGPDPSGEFYLVIAFDSAIGLVLGDAARCHAAKKLKNGDLKVAPPLHWRKEYHQGRAAYSTRARFSRSGPEHDVEIRVGKEKEGPVLVVWIQKKTAFIRVERLQWNIRGHGSIFVEGVQVDVTWDVRDWFHSRKCGNATFTFRVRGRLDPGFCVERDDKSERKEVDGERAGEDSYVSLIMMCAYN